MKSLLLSVLFILFSLTVFAQQPEFSIKYHAEELGELNIKVDMYLF